MKRILIKFNINKVNFDFSVKDVVLIEKEHYFDIIRKEKIIGKLTKNKINNIQKLSGVIGWESYQCICDDNKVKEMEKKMAELIDKDFKNNISRLISLKLNLKYIK